LKQNDLPSELQQAWIPTQEFISTTNMAWLMHAANVTTYEQLHTWSVRDREGFWKIAIERLGIVIRKPYSRVLDLSNGMETPRWLPDARMNIVESCFTAAPDAPAILSQAENGPITTTTFAELEALTNRVAASLVRDGFKPGNAIAVIMPMTVECVAIYLGIIKAGCAVVGIADSFRPKEIAVRLRIANTVAIFTQDIMIRAGKSHPLYANLVEAEAPRAIVLPAGEAVTVSMRAGDRSWRDFLSSEIRFDALLREPTDCVNILFSSGTTGEPKAIPWTHTTPIKCAMDAHFHQNIQAGDVVAWPTNIGWMMGPWLIFASLMNRSAMALYNGVPSGRAFGQFIHDTKTTMLGVVPSLVKAWRNSACMDGLDWTRIKLFSSTGECSTADDMDWLMKLAGGRPVIEYCGGTEIGGGYITGTVTRPCAPGIFNTPALSLDIAILNESGEPARNGELYLIPPSIGLSTTLLNKDHHDVYYAHTPHGQHGETLRRHGDQIEQLSGGYWRALGRADDTMNLGGIKVSSAEIETALHSVPDVLETAAIAIAPGGGPSQLVIYAVLKGTPSVTRSELMAKMQTAIKTDLNPLFKIHDLVFIDAMPRTASNKVMRRTLRDRYLAKS